MTRGVCLVAAQEDCLCFMALSVNPRRAYLIKYIYYVTRTAWYHTTGQVPDWTHTTAYCNQLLDSRLHMDALNYYP